MINYIDYYTFSDSYTVSEAAAFLGMTIDDLWRYCLKYNIHPTLNSYGVPVLSKYKVRAIHNRIYHDLEP